MTSHRMTRWERLLRHFDVGPREECWEWRGRRRSFRRDGTGGYGCFDATTAYRAVYEELIGPVPTGLQLDHLCNNPGCVNPYHLDPTTAQKNLARRDNSYLTKRWADFRESTAEFRCGCPMSEDNTYHRPDGARVCRHHRRLSQQADKAKQRARRAAGQQPTTPAT